MCDSVRPPIVSGLSPVSCGEISAIHSLLARHAAGGRKRGGIVALVRRGGFDPF